MFSQNVRITAGSVKTPKPSETDMHQNHTHELKKLLFLHYFSDSLNDILVRWIALTSRPQLLKNNFVD